MSVFLILAAAAAGLGQEPAAAAPAMETVDFTVIGEGRGGPRSARYYKVKSEVDFDRDGVADESILKLICAGGGVRHASLQVLRSAASVKKKTDEPFTVVTRWVPPAAALRTAAFRYSIRKSEKAGLASRIGWTEVKLEESAGLCPR
jgi:hypothetical protein